MATFNTTPNPCPFNWYSSDPAFQADADRLVTFVMRRLGEDFLSVELTKKMIYTAFEEATMLFNANIIEYQAKSNLTSLLGTPTASIDPATGNYSQGSVNYTNTYVTPNLEWLNKQAEPYLSSIGYGQSQETYSGSIALKIGLQDYDLYTELKDQYGVPLYNYALSGSVTPMKVVEVYHFGPSNYIFNSNYMLAHGLAVAQNESSIQNTTYYSLPIFEDVLRGHMLQTANNIRMSHIRYRISGRMLRIFPTPRQEVNLWVRVMFPSNPGPAFSGSFGTSGSSYLTENGTPGQTIVSNFGIYGAANPASIAAGLVTYSSLNPWARSWIFQYTLAICKEMVGQVRTKMKKFPIPGAELELNGDDMLAQSKDEKTFLMEGDHGLISKLDSLTFDKLAEREATKAENMMKQLAFMPLPPDGLSWA